MEELFVFDQVLIEHVQRYWPVSEPMFARPLWKISAIPSCNHKQRYQLVWFGLFICSLYLRHLLKL